MSVMQKVQIVAAASIWKEVIKSESRPRDFLHYRLKLKVTFNSSVHKNENFRGKIVSIFAAFERLDYLCTKAEWIYIIFLWHQLSCN